MFSRLKPNWQSLSLSKRLTIINSLTFISTILVLMVVVYVFLDQLFYHNARQYMTEQLTTLKRLVNKKQVPIERLYQEIHWFPWEVENKQIYFYLVWIKDEEDRLIAATRTDSKNRKLPTIEQLPVRKDGYQFIRQHKNIYIVTSTVTKNPSYKHIILALDYTYQARILERFRNAMILIFILASLMLICVSYLLVRRNTKSLYDIVRSAESITLDHLHLPYEENCPHEVKRITNAFNKKLAVIDNAYKKLEASVSDLAHEVKTPLQIIIGQVELALFDPNDPQAMKSTLQSVYEELYRLNSMVENFLFIARVGNKDTTMALKRKLVSLNDETSAILQFFSLIANKRNINLHVSGYVTGWVDPILLRRVVINLVDNALKFTPSGGNVAIELSEDSEYSYLKVIDTGVGISEEKITPLTERFYQADVPSVTQSAGFGLGLNIIDYIVKLHGGKLAIESEEGKGTVVTVSFTHGARKPQDEPLRVAESVIVHT